MGTTFVLVHGAWGGSYGFRMVRGPLRETGHEVYTPSLTGIGERAHLASPQVNLTTHITDVANAILYEDLTDIVLLGYSYGGMVITGALTYVADRVAHLVYLDAFLPGDGDSLNDLAGGEHEAVASGTDAVGAGGAGTVGAGTVGAGTVGAGTVGAGTVGAGTIGAVGAGTVGAVGAVGPGDGWLIPPADRTFDNPGEAAWHAPRRVPHPRGCFSEPVRLHKPLEDYPFTRTYIKATDEPRPVPGQPASGAPPRPFWAAADRVRNDPAWRYREVDTNHMIPANRPRELADLLLELT